MLVLQGSNAAMMAFGAETLPAPQNEPQPPATAPPTTTAQRVATARRYVVSRGAVTTLSSASITTAIFAGAFGLARTERVWAPALFLGGLTLLAGIARTAMQYSITPELVAEYEREDAARAAAWGRNW